MLAASIAAARAGVAHEAIAAAVRTFRAVEHRLEFVRSLSGVDFYNDSKATSVDATLKAARRISRRPLGDSRRQGQGPGIHRAARAARRQGACRPADRRRRRQDRRSACRAPSRWSHAKTIDAAVAHAYAHAAPGDTVLLAPACASFDQFQSYEHRGEVLQRDCEPAGGERLNMAQRLKTDWILFFTVLAMVFAGVLIVYSASSIMAQMDPRYHSAWYFVQRQAAWAVIALIIMMALKSTHYRKLQNPAVALSAISVSLFLLVAVYFFDPDNHRWLRVGGPVGVQPSELAKPALVVFLAFFVTWRARAINNPRYTLVPAAMAVGLVILAVVVADLGTAIVLGAAAALVFFVAGLEKRYCAIVGALAMIGLVFFVFAKPYRLARVVHVLRSAVQDHREVR